MNLARQFHVVTLFEECACIHLFHVHQHVIHLIINVIESFQVCLVAAIIGVSGHIHPHCFQIQQGGGEVRFRPEFVGADVQLVRSDQLGVQVH